MFAVYRTLPARDKLGLRYQPDFQPRAVTAPILQGFQVQAVQFIAFVFELTVMPHPVCKRIFSVRTRRLQDQFPKPFHSRICPFVRENFLRPTDGRHRRNTPLIFVCHCVLIGLYDRAPCHGRKRQFFSVRTFHSVRIRRKYLNGYGQFFRPFTEFFFFP